MDKLKRIAHSLAYPTDGFDDLKENRVGISGWTALVLLLFFAARICRRQFPGFLFNYEKASGLNILYVFAQTVLLFVLWTACAWAVSTLLDGKAKFREIWTVSAVALIPYVGALFVNVALSNVLLTTEALFMSIVQAVGIVWGVWILLSGLMDYQYYTLGKVIVSIFLSVALMAVFLFIIILLFSLFQQVVNFAGAVVREILLRLK